MWNARKLQTVLHLKQREGKTGASETTDTAPLMSRDMNRMVADEQARIANFAIWKSIRYGKPV